MASSTALHKSFSKIISYTLFHSLECLYLAPFSMFHSSPTNIFFNAPYALKRLHNITNFVAKHVTPGYTISLLPIYCLINYITHVLVYINFGMVLALCTTSTIQGNFSMSSNRKPRQWFAHGVKHRMGNLSSNIVLVATYATTLSMMTWTTFSNPIPTTTSPNKCASISTFLTCVDASTNLENTNSHEKSNKKLINVLLLPLVHQLNMIVQPLSPHFLCWSSCKN